MAKPDLGTQSDGRDQKKSLPPESPQLQPILTPEGNKTWRLAQGFEPTSNFSSGGLADNTKPEQIVSGKSNGGMELSPTADIDKIVPFLKNNRQAVDYSKIWPKDVPVMFVGETHPVLSDKQEIIDHLKELKEKDGLTHVAFEVFQEKDQPLLDKYFNNAVPREDVRKLLDQWAKWGPG